MLATDRILALDIGASTVKVAEFLPSKTSGLRLVNFNHADLNLDPDHEENRQALIVATIKNVLREKRIKAKRVVFSVSGQSVFTRFVKLPPVDQTKVVQIIQYEAQQNVPFPIDEVIWDYQLVGSSDQGELEVVLLAIKSEIIEELNAGVESAGLRTEMVDVAPLALYNAIRYNEPETDGCTLIVDIGARTTNLLFLEKNRVFTRSIPIAGNAITRAIADELHVTFLEAEQLKRRKGFVALGGAYEEPEDEQQAQISKLIRNVMTRLHADIARSINFYRSQRGGTAPNRILLSGGSSIIPYTDRFFAEKIPAPIQYFNPFRNVEIAPSISREELARCAHFFGEVVGLALRRVTECPMEVNLLPQSIRARKAVAQRRPYLIGAGVSVLLIPLCWLAYLQKTATLKRLQLDQVQQQAASLSKFADQAQKQQRARDELKGKADQISELVHQRTYWTELLQDLNLRVSSNVWIVSLVPETASSAAAGGVPGAITAPGHATPSGFRRTMEEAPVEAPAATAVAIPGATTSFSELRIEGAGNHSADDLKLVDALAKSLRESPFFDQNAPEKGVDITAPPKAEKDQTIFTFQLRVKLKEPITY